MECNIDRPLNLLSEPDLKVEMSFWSFQISQKTNKGFVFDDFCPSLLKEVK